MNVPTSPIPIPQLFDDEIYAGAIIAPDGTGHHLTLLPGDSSGTWDESMKWAQSIGGDLPDRVEQALLYRHLSDRFKKDGYWSSTQHAGDSSYAWYQNFVKGGVNGNQYDISKSAELFARAVRRSVI